MKNLGQITSATPISGVVSTMLWTFGSGTA